MSVGVSGWLKFSDVCVKIDSAILMLIIILIGLHHRRLLETRLNFPDVYAKFKNNQPLCF